MADRRSGFAVLLRRAVGRGVDVILWAMFVIILAIPTGSDASGEMTYPLWVWIAQGGVPITYETVMVWRRGQTVGMVLSGVTVVTTGGASLPLPLAIVRAAMTWPLLVLAFNDQLGVWVQVPAAVVYFVVFAVALTNRQGRGLHDFASRSVAILDPAP